MTTSKGPAQPGKGDIARRAVLVGLLALGWANGGPPAPGSAGPPAQVR